ncbi:hypothetical protein I302_105011 [Kwoniella bestiolae CBS 10118]|uniref:Uncharacterized protein n=1 Tax=Kwoniella bestiolae CBS 10118 TaxID=1296100 RepID=A0A1B9FR46_9TREE|nr:hypothetical protein I302_08916 [Kwoniella bestiolae CBS 10118]OCF21244.1 hypothetical protein I302_08916 [Kwoniella bestiolae CBS 10118]
MPKDYPDNYTRKGVDPSIRFPDELVYRAEICEAELKSLVGSCKGDIGEQDLIDYIRIGEASTNLYQIERGIERVLKELSGDWKECMKALSEEERTALQSSSDPQMRSYNLTVDCLQTLGSSQTKELEDLVNEETDYDWEDKHYLIFFTQNRDWEYEIARMTINEIEQRLTDRNHLPWKELNWAGD